MEQPIVANALIRADELYTNTLTALIRGGESELCVILDRVDLRQYLRFSGPRRAMCVIRQ